MRHKPVIAAIALLLVSPGLTLGQVSKKTGEGQPPTAYYQAVLGTGGKSFDQEDNPGVEADGTAGGTLEIWLNGDPIGFFTGGLLLFPTHHSLRPGKNELILSGKHTKPVYALVIKGRTKDDKFLGMAGKKKIDPDGKEAQPVLFTVEQAPKLPER